MLPIVGLCQSIGGFLDKAGMLEIIATFVLLALARNADASGILLCANLLCTVANFCWIYAFHQYAGNWHLEIFFLVMALLSLVGAATQGYKLWTAPESYWNDGSGKCHAQMQLSVDNFMIVNKDDEDDDKYVEYHRAGEASKNKADAERKTITAKESKKKK